MGIEDLGIKVGLEIHQQLDVGKLFCKCPSLLTDEAFDYLIERKLRAVAGEQGGFDVAALQEQLRGRLFVYEGNRKNSCLVELDEEPPHKVNQRALKFALTLSLLLKSRIVSVAQVMRKTVVDGSNTSGFQRTILVAQKGFVETFQGPVNINSVLLEEDACRIVSQKGSRVIYRLDRLGIPLVEIGTKPDIRSPTQAKEVAEFIGMVLRSIPGVKRGLGTIRQDVNVSIKEGRRVEIKGAQDLASIPKLIELEAYRQNSLVKIKRELEKRESNLIFSPVDLSDVGKKSKSHIIKKSGNVFGLKLHKFVNLIGRETLPGKRLGSEFSERAKVISGVGGIFHSDELPKYGISEADVLRFRRELGCGSDDGFVLVCAEKNQALSALEAVFHRAIEALDGVPGEVRKANSDFTTSYLRPIPGAARMYPETDIPLIFPDFKGIDLPELLNDKIGRFVKQYNLSRDLAVLITKSNKRELFVSLAEDNKSIKPSYIASVLTQHLKEIKKVYDLEPDISDDAFRKLFSLLSEGVLHKDVVLDALIDMIKGCFDQNKFVGIKTEELHDILIEIINENPRAGFGALMGIAAKKLKGLASGKKISEMLRELLKKHESMKGQEKVK